MKPTLATVHLFGLPYHADRGYSYYVPERIDTPTVGALVTVPFGGGNRPRIGVVTEITASGEIPSGIKPIVSTLAERLTPSQLRLCEYLKKTVFCSIGDAASAIAPNFAVPKLREYFEVVKMEGKLDISESAIEIVAFIFSNGRVSAEVLTKKFGADASAAARSLCGLGILTKSTDEIGRSEQSDKFAELIAAPDKPPRSKDQVGVIEYLTKKQNGALASEIKKKIGAELSVLRTLEKKGIVKITELPVYRDPYNSPTEKISPEDTVLSDEQTSAAERIRAVIDTRTAKAVLLHGVTGSGKTRVIIDAIFHALKTREGGVIVLVPEIALTPQAAAVYKGYFGDTVTIIHSALSSGERYDAWRRVKNGDVRICVGTRSAIFAPFEKIALIVIDEEQDGAYKSDSTPRYHAREVARFLCAEHKCALLLSSATPSLDSYHKAVGGKYELIKLTKRYNAELPKVTVCDMRGAPITPIGEPLRERLLSVYNSGGQSVLLLNRRGYNNFALCPDCGNVVKCPNCSVSLTRHISRGRGVLSCHYCGYNISEPKNCPECGGDKLYYQGYGTQMIEQVLSEIIPQARVLRLDADTTSGKFSFDRFLSEFRSGAYDIMIGTQMVAKGHDFPNVRLVGVLNADQSLYLNDYHSNERTFSLITQVVGRSGRAGSPGGEALIQTFNPDHAVITLAAAQDYEGFYKNEIALRKAFTYPPFCDVALIMLSSGEEGALLSTSAMLNSRMRSLLAGGGEFSDVKLQIFGPFEASVYKIENRYRMRFILKIAQTARTREFIARLINEFAETGGRKVTVSVDINPSSV